VNAYRKTNAITVSQGVAGNPIMSFQEGGFPEYLMNTIAKENYTEPTPIQAQGWPIALSGK
jgi:ATP-dependent RNA helicase DDX5/DBP2